MPKRKQPCIDPELYVAPLFPGLPTTRQARRRKYLRVQDPIWTEHKAAFIQKYLRYFVQITKHGAYIDGFAGPQRPDRTDCWTAKLVLESEPKWLRDIHLCDISKSKYKMLQKLKAEQPEPRDRSGRKLRRNIEVCRGDFNVKVNEILGARKISQKEATFCLLDQRTFECHWETLKKLAAYKASPANKVELLYFLGVGWLHRAFSGLRDKEKMTKWWGRNDWEKLPDMRAHDIAELVRQRFEQELGYAYSAAYPIYDREKGNRVMYYMIHASDHDEAPALMVRAHAKAVRALPIPQEKFSFIGDAQQPAHTVP